MTIVPVDLSRSFITCSATPFPAGVTITPNTILIPQLSGATGTFCDLSANAVSSNGYWFVTEFRFGVRVQRGKINLVDFSDGGQYFKPAEVNIRAVNLVHSFLLVSADPQIDKPRGQNSLYLQSKFKDADTIEFSRGSSDPGNYWVYWQVVEFEDVSWQSGVAQMDAFTGRIFIPIQSVDLGKSLLLFSYYGLNPGFNHTYPSGQLGVSQITFSRSPLPGTISYGQLVRIAWQVLSFSDETIVQQPEAVTFGTVQKTLTPPAAMVQKSVCQLICPAGRSVEPSLSSVLLRIANPNGPAINTSVVFGVPAEIRPVNLGTNLLWDESSRLLTVFLGAFAASEEKTASIDFEGQPSGCVIYGELRGEWSPPPTPEATTWQSEVNFSTVLPEERCLSTSAAQQIIDRLLPPVQTIDSGATSGIPGGTFGERLTQAVGQTFQGTVQAVEQIRENPTVKAVGAPVNVGAAAAGVLATAASVPFAWNLLELLRFILLGFLRFKKQQPWGIVFDDLLKQPVAGAVVKILDTEFQKVRETRATDAQGRFGFLVPAGTYYLKASKTGYKDAETPVFNIIDPRKELPNLEVGLLPLSGAADLKKLNRIKTFNEIRRLLHLLNPYILAIGTALSILMFVLFPTLINALILAVYIILDTYKVWLTFHVVKPYGRVLDRADQQPLPLSIVRAFNKGNNWLTATHVTDEQGRFDLLLMPGDYRITAVKDGYKQFKSEELDLRKPGAVTKDIELKRG